MVVILDALDEAQNTQRNALVEIVKRKWTTQVPKWLGLLISSRPENPIKKAVEKFDPVVFEVKSEANVGDVETFVASKCKRYLANPEKDLQPAVRLLADRSKGLFIVARLTTDMLQKFGHGSVTMEDFKHATLFPSNMEDVYVEYFSRFLKGPLDDDIDMYQALFSCMVVARDPLDVEIVGVLIGAKDERSVCVWNPSGTLTK